MQIFKNSNNLQRLIFNFCGYLFKKMYLVRALKKYGLRLGRLSAQFMIVCKIKLCRRSYVLMSPNSIGEVAIVCAFSRAFKEKYSQDLVLVVREGHREIAELYKHNLNKIICAPISLMRRFNCFGLSDTNSFKVGKPINLWTKLRGDGRLDEVHELRGISPSRGGLSFTDVYRHLMHLDWNSRLELLNIEEHKGSVNNKKPILKKRSIILFPSTNSNKPISSEYWESIAGKYHSADYDVYCNIKGGAYTYFSPPSYVKVLDLDIMAAIRFVNECDSVIIGSNGLVILMLILQVKTSINVLLSNEILDYDAKKFRSYPMLSTSHRLVTPELVAADLDFREFIIDESVSPSELAEAIYSGNRDDLEVTDQMIDDLLRLDRKSQAGKLIYNMLPA